MNTLWYDDLEPILDFALPLYDLGFSISPPIAARISSAICTADSAGLGNGTGSPKITITPAPANRSSVPSYREMSCPMLS